MKAVLLGLVAFTIPLGLLYQNIVHDVFVSLPMTIIMIVAGFLFSSVSAYMAGMVGSSNNPVSGITIGTILFASLILTMLMGRNAPLGPVAAIMIGAVVCCAAAIAGDNLQDLKCGHMIGATPWRQQVMLAIGAASCALVMAPMLNLLNEAYGIGVPPSELHRNPLQAPQATLMASVAKGLFGGHLPWNMIGIGAAIGAVIIAFDSYLKKSGASFRVPVLAAAVGIYLPIENTAPIFLGGLASFIVERLLAVKRDPDSLERLHRRGVLFSAGLITGEALMGIVIAVAIVLSKRADVLALPDALHFGEFAGVLVLAAVGYMLFHVARAGAREVEKA